MNIGERLKELRLEYGLSQAKLAKETGLTQSSIFYWEKGLKIPTAQAVVILAKYFGVTTDYLLGLEDWQALRLAIYLNTLPLDLLFANQT